MSLIDQRTFSFEGFTLDLRRGCLTRGGRQIELRPKSFAVLHYLVQNAGRLVAKEEMMRTVWGDVAVTDASLARCVSDVRLALQDGQQLIIRTVPRRGYLLDVPVQPGNAGATPTPGASATIESTEKSTVRERHSAGCRQLTVMACDLAGLETKSVPLDPEDLRAATTTCYRDCAAIVERHHGYVARCAGDGLLAYFGYPQAREQDAENAVRAALKLRDAAAKLSADLEAPLQPCIGIATGMVVIDDDLTSDTQELSVVGETLTLSARLRALAEPGQIVIAESTRRLVAGLFDYRDLGHVRPRGLMGPLAITQVIGESGLESRFEARHPAELTPLVGRDEEIALLLRRWRRATDGDGSVVLLAGEAGIGKSRLAQAVLELLSHEPHARMRLFCSPHRQDSALSPFISQLERLAGFSRGDTADQRLSKLEAALAPGTKEPGETVSLLASLLSMPSGARDPQLTLTPQQRKERTLHALLAQIEALAAARPLLMILEDAHWADPTSIELLDLIVERAPQLRILLVITSRPEFKPPWTDRVQTISIALGRLSARDCEQIVAGVLQGIHLPTSLVDEILRRTDGVPLFVEELTKAVVENNALTDDSDHGVAAKPRGAPEIPLTLHASLLARLDRLAAAREVAQIGAALGRQFSYMLISAVAPTSKPELDDALGRLVQAGLIWQRGSLPEAEFTFKHALIQDVAYGTLLREPRRALHARIAKTLEAKFAEIAEAQPELLAHHCTEAGLIEKAALLWGKAGNLSLARSALKEAAAQLGRALGLIESLPGTAALRREQIKLQIALANALMHTRGYAAPETKAALDRARLLVARAEALGEPPEDPLLLLSVLHGFWVASHVAFNGDAVRDLAVEFMALAEKQGTVLPLALGHRLMGTSLLFLGEPVEGLAHLDRAISLYDPIEHRTQATRFGHDVGAAILSNRPLALWLLGQPETAAKGANHAVEHARDVGQKATFLYTLARIIWFHLVVGNYDTAAAQIRQLMDLSRDVEGSYWSATGMLLQGCLFALTGEGPPGIEQITTGIAVSRSTGWNLLRMPWYLSCLAKAHVALGQHEQANHSLAEAMAAMAATKETWQEADLHRIAGDFALLAPEPNVEQAQAHYHRALAVARRQKAKSWELRAAKGLARLWRDRGRRRQALDLLAPIHDSFSDGFDTRDLKAAGALLAELASQD